MDLTCQRHGWEIADAMCGACGLPFCGSCLFRVSETDDTPVCVPCALAKAGVRRQRQPRLSRKERRVLAQHSSAPEPAVTPSEADEVTPTPCPPAESVPEPAWVTLDSNQWEIRPA